MFALSTLDTWIPVLPLTRSSIALPDPDPDANSEPARTTPRPCSLSCSATASSAWFAGSESPAGGRLAGMTTTASVASDSVEELNPFEGLTCRYPCRANPDRMGSAWLAGRSVPSVLTSAGAITSAASCWPATCALRLFATVWSPGVTVGGATVWARASRLLSVLALVSKNAGCSSAWPVTFAPAWSRAVVIPLMAGPLAPGAVTSTTFSPVSRLASTSGAETWANCWSL